VKVYPMKIPSNVVRCLNCKGPIIYPLSGGQYRCKGCEAGKTRAERAEPGYYWEESYGYLVQVDYDNADERDTEEEVSDLYSALKTFADVLGDGMTAFHVGGSFTCSEAESMAQALMVGGHKHAAMTFLEGHADGDDDEDDIHRDVKDYEAWVLELAGKPVPELIEEPEPESDLPTVTTEELLKLMNLD
jgi:hypothetical protein